MRREKVITAVFDREAEANYVCVTVCARERERCTERYIKRRETYIYMQRVKEEITEKGSKNVKINVPNLMILPNLSNDEGRATLPYLSTPAQLHFTTRI